MTVANPFANVSFKDLSRIAVYLSDKIIKSQQECCDWWSEGSEHLTLSLAVWKMLCELKEFGELRTRPEDLIWQAYAAVIEFNELEGDT